MKICTLDNLFSNFLWCYKPSTVIDIQVRIINYSTEKQPSSIKLGRSRTAKLEIYQLLHFNACQIVHLSSFQPVSQFKIQYSMTTMLHCGLNLHLDTTIYSFCSRKWYISGPCQVLLYTVQLVASAHWPFQTANTCGPLQSPPQFSSAYEDFAERLPPRHSEEAHTHISHNKTT